VHSIIINTRRSCDAGAASSPSRRRGVEARAAAPPRNSDNRATRAENRHERSRTTTARPSALTSTAATGDARCKRRTPREPEGDSERRRRTARPGIRPTRTPRTARDSRRHVTTTSRCGVEAILHESDGECDGRGCEHSRRPRNARDKYVIKSKRARIGCRAASINCRTEKGLVVTDWVWDGGCQRARTRRRNCPRGTNGRKTSEICAVGRGRELNERRAGSRAHQRIHRECYISVAERLRAEDKPARWPRRCPEVCNQGHGTRCPTEGRGESLKEARNTADGARRALRVASVIQ
jgi:hypothetical protein